MRVVDPNDRWESIYRLAVEIARDTDSEPIRMLAWHIQHEALIGKFGRAVADEVGGRFPPLYEVPS